ncbi:unnamed protein product [Leptidea sinapis]|uniref:LRRCT domain-containing protein n=1 Tax=Leptidea sinapis TaxID=189913 RepID=A0A5E4R2K8_9NEOP|nr:unnamed protein product [Leptidea sinapis]
MSWQILALTCTILILHSNTEGIPHHEKREAPSDLCKQVFNATNKVQCFCTKDTHEPKTIRSADCYPTINDVAPDDPIWSTFEDLKNLHKLTFANTRGIVLKYIPKRALEHTKYLLKLEMKYGNIETIESFDFANLTFIEEITLRDNQIKVLKKNAFAHHRDLVTLGLDTNVIVEINRDVFIDLPSLEKLYLTSNKITTIHDRAFIHLTNLKELEIDRNILFSLNSETFSGLNKLEKLDLSSNSLEVIGDNTFLPLSNLKSLNLDGNKIEMLDEKAFHGLPKLQSLSLAHNSIKDLGNDKLFIGLKSLMVLNLKSNQISNLKPEVMEPLLGNLAKNISSLDVEDNMFPCDCRLDWFLYLMNTTSSHHLSLGIENLKCIPSNEIRDKWTKTVEAEKNAPETEDNAPSNDYEYYDDTQLNGKLFYIDMRFLLNCTANFDNLLKSEPVTNKPIITKQKETSVTSTTKLVTITTTLTNTDKVTKNPLNANAEPTTKHPETLIDNNSVSNIKKSDLYTTSKLSTVSAKPMANNLFDDHDMASDEGKPDKIKAHRSIQDDVNEFVEERKNIGSKNIGCITMYIAALSIKLVI